MIRKVKRLVQVSHIKSRREQKELEARFVFHDLASMDVIISFDDVEMIARIFDQMASAVQVPSGK